MLRESRSRPLAQLRNSSGGVAPDTAKILLDAFSRFDIPYRSGVTSNDMIPDNTTVELFVSHKP